jgi:glycosyltransferase involved in cell wall biosynthesis
MGGAERFALRLLRHAAVAGGYLVHVVCPLNSVLAEQCRAAGIEPVGRDFPNLAPWRLPRQLPAVARTRRLLIEAREDGGIVVANTSRTQAYAVAAAAFVLHPPAIVHIAHEQDTAHRLSARLALPRQGSLLAVGANATTAYRAALPSVEVDQVNNFLTSDEVTRLRAGPHPSHHGVVIGLIARMIPEKGVLELVDELAAVDTAWTALLVATAPEDRAYEAEVRMRVGALGLDQRVRLMGQVQDIPGLLHGVDVVVVPSTGTEGQPSVILEALAAGVGVVVREPLYSADYEGLPVFAYKDANDLRPALAAAMGSPPAATAVLLKRFGADQALVGLQRAAQRAITRQDRQ